MDVLIEVFLIFKIFIFIIFVNKDTLEAMSLKWNMNRMSLSQPFSRQQEKTPYEEAQHCETSSLLSLPSEILNYIAQFLTIDDLLACSLACSRLRAVFDDDLVWKRFCRPYIFNYIKYAKRKVNINRSFHYDLDSICDERLNYIHENQLLNNWKYGRFVEYQIHSTSDLYYMSLKSGSPIIYRDIYLFLYDFTAHNIVVWNIENEPEIYCKKQLLYYNYYYEGLFYEIVGSKLIVLEVGKFIQIYNINLPDKSLPLVCLLLVDDNEPLSKIPDFSRPEDMYAVCYHKIIGNRTYSQKVGKAILHIWDVETQKKITALKPPHHGSVFDVLSATNNGNDLILCLEINDSQKQYNHLGRIYEVLAYDFSKNTFKIIWNNKHERSIPYIPFHAIQHSNTVILFCRLHNFYVEESNLPKTNIIFYNYEWKVIIAEKSFPELVCHRQTKVTNNKIILATSFCIYIMELKNFDIISTLKFDNGKIELLNVFDGKFIIMTPKSLLTRSKTKIKEVWDLKNRRRCIRVTYVFQSPYSNDSVFVNESFTKMVIVGKGTLAILNFW